MPCMVRLRRDCCPEITRVGSAFPLANLANAEILGSLTQLGTRISSRFESYATAPGFPKPTVGDPAGALRRIRLGATLPVAAIGKMRMELSPLFATAISLRWRSTSMAIGQFRPVLAP